MIDLLVLVALAIAAVGFLIMILVSIGTRRPEDWEVEGYDLDELDPHTIRYRQRLLEDEEERRRGRSEQ
jgi:hypothetical protein